MDERIAGQIEIAALLNCFTYLDNNAVGIEGGTLKEILDVMGAAINDRGDELPQEYLQLKAAVEDNPDFGRIMLIDRSATNDTQKWTDDLIQAATFRDCEGNYYVAYRGTGEGRWTDNGEGMTARVTLMQQAAADYYDGVAEKYFLNAHKNGAEIIVTGHSKGGNESQFVTMAAEYEYLIDRCYSFDGQGFSDRAAEYFESRYGSGYSDRQQKKLFSICGENDYVNELGRQIVPKDNVYYVPTTGSGMTEWHHITNMLGAAAAGAVTYTGLQWKRGEDGKIMNGIQGSVGAFAKALSKEMMQMDEENLHGTAIALMWVIDYLGMAENRNEWEQLGEIKPTATDFVDLLAHGLPAIEKTLFFTDEGKVIIDELLVGLSASAEEKLGKAGAAGMAGLIAAAAGPFSMAALFLGAVQAAAWIADIAIDAIDGIKSLGQKAAEPFKNMVRSMSESLSERIKTELECRPEAVESGNEPFIMADTGLLRNHAEMLARYAKRVQAVKEELSALSGYQGAGGLTVIMRTAPLSSVTDRLKLGGIWLVTTAKRLEDAEREIIKTMQAKVP